MSGIITSNLVVFGAHLNSRNDALAGLNAKVASNTAAAARGGFYEEPGRIFSRGPRLANGNSEGPSN